MIRAFIWPVLCMSTVACQAERESRIDAATAAIEHALAIHATLEKAQICPAELDGWVPEPADGMVALATRAGNADRQYKISYKCSEDRRTFEIDIHYSFDDHVAVIGTFDGPLEIVYGHFTDSKKLIVSETPDIPHLAELLAYGQ